MTGGWVRRFPVLLFAAITAGLAVAGLASATNPNERVVEPQRNVLDSDDIRNKDSKVWVFDFKFKDPRLIKVNVPGRGQKVVWYLWYQVINKTPKPQTFYPDFELKTNDLNMVYHDEILPAAEEAIRNYEDPRNFLKIKNSVTISTDPIPPSRPDAVPTAVTGVAIWIDPNDANPGDDEKTKAAKEKMPKLADTNNFSVFIAGLSNGWAKTDGPDGKPIVRRKTLQLNFHRTGDRFFPKSEEIRFAPPYQWIYRGSSLDIPGLPGQTDK